MFFPSPLELPRSRVLWPVYFDLIDAPQTPQFDHCHYLVQCLQCLQCLLADPQLHARSACCFQTWFYNYHKHAGLSKIGMCTKFGLIGKMLMIQWDWGYFNFIVWQIYVQMAWSGKSGQDVFAAHVSPWRRLAIWRTSSNQVEDAKSSKQ